MKRLLIPGIVLAVLVIIVAIGAYFGSDYAEGKIRAEITNSLKEGAAFECGDIEVSLFKGRVKIITPRVTYTDSADHQWSIEADAIAVNLKLIDFIRGKNRAVLKTIDIAVPQIRIEAENPDFDIFIKSDEGTDADMFRHFKVGTVTVSAGHLNFLSGKPGGVEVDFSADGSNLRFDSETSAFDADHYAVRCTDFSHLNPDSTYNITAGSAIFKNTSPALEFIDLQMKSVYGKKAFQERQSTRKSRHDIDIKRVSIYNPQMDGDSSVSIKRIHIHKPHFELSRDNGKPFEDRITLMPQEMLTGLDTQLQIDSLTLLEGSLTVELTNKHSEAVAVLKFTRVNAEVTDIQNIDLDAPAFTARAFGIFEGETETSIYTRYDYGPESPWQLKVTGTTLDLEKVSPVLAGASRVEILSGNMTELTLSMSGDKHRTEGEMDLRYENLSAYISDKKGGNSSKVKHFIVEKIGNIFYREEVTGDKRGAKSVEFETDRDVRKGFVGQWLDGLLRGAIETVVKPDENKVGDVRDWFKKVFGNEDDE